MEKPIKKAGINESQPREISNMIELREKITMMEQAIDASS